jgi:CheY-like chemotaxis protein
VDDEPALREIFQKWLIAIGCGRVLLAADGKVALEILETERIDLLLTDVRMPVMDGVSLVRNLGKLLAKPPSIVFVSGFGDVDHKEMYALGVEAFISKPIERKELLRVLEHALADRTTLWTAPLLSAPRQTMVITAEDHKRGGDEVPFCLGRGGFSVRYDEPLGLSKVAFECRFGSDEIVTGEGYVRWYTRAEQTVGIEFAYLDAVCRDRLLEQIASTQPRSFIPNIGPGIRSAGGRGGETGREAG